jgi:adenosylcobinamide-GDP ribazoletransferase
MFLDGLVSAIRTLTILPVPGREPDKRYKALPWFAIAGLGIGSVQYAAAKGLTCLPAQLSIFGGLLLAVINYAFTGAMHLDGLADSADAFGTFNTREKTLAILKDSHIGSFGAAAIVLIIIWRIIAYQQIININQAIWIIYAPGISRILQGFILLLFPYPRGSEGKAYGFKGPFWVSIILILQTIIIEAFILYKHGPYTAILPLALGLVIIAWLLIVSMRRIGGITGDCIGAITELFECAFLTGAIACM